MEVNYNAIHVNGWRFSIMAITAILSLPIMVVLVHVFLPAGEIWDHLLETVLFDYIRNSLLLMLGVAFGTVIGGVGCAWLASMCDFAGRRWFEWALLLPMALPAYIIAYTYTGLLDYAGTLQTFLRDMIGGHIWFPDIRSLGGAIIMMSLVLYPYVYLLTRAAFLNQSICVLDVSRTLGNGPWRTFFTLALPLARPAIVAGLTLALMESLADYGTVQYFGVQTFTTGIFKAWYGLDSEVAALQLSAVLMLFMLVLIVMEQISRQKARFHHTSQYHQAIRRIHLKGIKAWLAVAFCTIPVLFGFVIPAVQLVWWSVLVADSQLNQQFITLLWHSMALALTAAFLSVLLALALGYGQRLHPFKWIKGAVKIAGMGYAIPGTVIAVGIIIPLAWIDNRLDGFMRTHFNLSTGLWLSGTLVALIFAYMVRFLAVSLQAVNSGLNQIKPTLDEAGRTLGHSPIALVKRIHAPLLKASLLTALLLVFVDVLKELPATLILRPFNYNTLAVRAYEMASDERLAQAGPAALAIVAAGIIPVIMLNRLITKTRISHEKGTIG